MSDTIPMPSDGSRTAIRQERVERGHRFEELHHVDVGREDIAQWLLRAPRTNEGNGGVKTLGEDRDIVVTHQMRPRLFRFPAVDADDIDRRLREREC